MPPRPLTAVDSPVEVGTSLTGGAGTNSVEKAFAFPTGAPTAHSLVEQAFASSAGSCAPVAEANAWATFPKSRGLAALRIDRESSRNRGSDDPRLGSRLRPDPVEKPTGLSTQSRRARFGVEQASLARRVAATPRPRAGDAPLLSLARLTPSQRLAATRRAIEAHAALNRRSTDPRLGSGLRPDPIDEANASSTLLRVDGCKSSLSLSPSVSKGP